jgi:hypothetical protein
LLHCAVTGSPKSEVSESDRYLNPPWWHAPVLKLVIGVFVYLMVFCWLYAEFRLMPSDLVGLGFLALVALVVTILGAACFQSDSWLRGRPAVVRWIAALVLIAVGGGLLVLMWMTSANWLPHFQ